MKISLLHMDERTRRSLALALSHGHDGVVVVPDVESAEVAVIDCDDVNAAQTLATIRAQNPALRVIGIGAGTLPAPADIPLLCKPVSAGRLLEATRQLMGVTRVRAAGAAAALGARTEPSRRRPESATSSTQAQQFFDPASYLLGAVMEASSEAKNRDQVAIVRFYGDRVVLIDARSGLVRTNLSSSQARGFAMTPLEAGAPEGVTIGLRRPQIDYLPRAEADATYGATTSGTDQERFMWTLGFLTSRGRLSVGCRVKERTMLRRWPNLTRLSHSTNDMRILAYWTRQAATPQEIADALDVPLTEVYSVHAAACAAGLMRLSSRAADETPAAPPPERPKERGLFSQILGRLLQRKPTPDVTRTVAA